MPVIDLNIILNYFLYGWLILILLISSITDLNHRRIPNLVTLPTIFIALLVNTQLGGWDGLMFSLKGLAFGFAVFLLPYLLGGMGAGDVKLMSGVGAVLGFNQAAVSLLFIAVCGGIMALGLMIYRRNLKATLLKTFLAIFYLGMHRDASLLKVDKNTIAQEGIPYGVAITSGVFLFFLYLIFDNTLVPAFRAF